MARILITGASGFLGWNLAADLQPEHEVTAGYLRHRPEIGRAAAVELDVVDARAVARVVDSAAPDLVIHSAALSNPDDCERRPEAARAVNVEGTRHVAAAARAAGARLVYLSTDLVFDGSRGGYREEDPAAGRSVYARNKIEAEGLVAEADPRAVVLRLALLYGSGSPFYPGFLDTALTRWRAGEAMTFYVDQFRTPAPASSVSEVIRRLLARPDVRGLFHVGGADRISRHDFARLLADEVGADASLIRAGSMHDAGAVAPRGADCSLVSERLGRVLGLAPVSCRAGLGALAARGRLARISGGA